MSYLNVEGLLNSGTIAMTINLHPGQNVSSEYIIEVVNDSLWPFLHYIRIVHQRCSKSFWLKNIVATNVRKI